VQPEVSFLHQVADIDARRKAARDLAGESMDQVEVKAGDLLPDLRVAGASEGAPELLVDVAGRNQGDRNGIGCHRSVLDQAAGFSDSEKPAGKGRVRRVRSMNNAVRGCTFFYRSSPTNT
jgi:hypothetical protein